MMPPAVHCSNVHLARLHPHYCLAVIVSPADNLYMTPPAVHCHDIQLARSHPHHYPIAKAPLDNGHEMMPIGERFL